MTKQAKRTLYALPEPSTALVSDVITLDAGGKIALLYDYDRAGETICSGLCFSAVRAYRHRAEVHCTTWEIDDVYDTLAEVTNSEWIAALQAATPVHWHGEWEMHHYMIYLDSNGCYEIVSRAWDEMPEMPGGWRERGVTLWQDMVR